MWVLRPYQTLLKNEKKNGLFKSFDDFINRVDPKDVNKLQMEGFTKAGVFDEFKIDRNKIFTSIPKIIQQIKNINEDKKNNQTSLFESNDNSINKFDFSTSVSWSQKNFYLKNLNL